MPKIRTIRGEKIFRAIAMRGRVYHGSAFSIKYLPRGKLADDDYLFGFVTSRKVGGAVKRNLLRRRLKSLVASSVCGPSLPSIYYYLIICKPAAAGFTFEQLREELDVAFDVICYGFRRNEASSRIRQRR